MAAVIVIVGLGSGLENYVADSFSSMGANTLTVTVQSRGATRTMEVEDMYALVAEYPEELELCSPTVSMMGGVKIGAETASTSVSGVSEDYNDIYGYTISKGRGLQYSDIATRAKVCVVGAYVDQAWFGGNAVGQTLRVGGQALTIVGVLSQREDSMEEGGSDDCLYLPYSTASRLGGSRVSSYVVTMVDEEHMDRSKAVLEQALTDFFGSDDYYNIITMSELVDAMTGMINILVGVLAGIAAISLVVGGIGIMNIMLVSVSERTREIGVRKSLGAKERYIMEQFVIEAAVTSALGGLIGIGLGYLLSAAATVVVARLMGETLTVAPTPFAVVMAFGVSAGIGVLFGYLPAQLSKAGSVGLLDGVSAKQGSKLTRQDCVDLFYNLLTAQTSAGAVYGTTLGYTISNGQVDYSALVTADTKGPYVADSASLSLPFTPDTVYYNGAASSLSAVQQYDVYYCNENMNTVWVYHDRVTGTLTGISPSAAAPTAVTVAGVSYQIGTSEAAYQFSGQGSFREGDMVTLLLGMNGEAVRAIDALENEAIYYGSVVSSTKAASTASTTSSATASAQATTQVACTDGVTRTFYHSGTAFSAGKLVTVSTTQSGTNVRSLSTKRLEGTVSKDGTGIGTYQFAAGVQILDTDDNGGYARIYPSRLAGAKLSGNDVRYYTLNAAGEIDRMVLHEVTGDTQPYVCISGIDDNSGEMNISVNYTYIQDGQTKTLSGGAKYPVKSGGAMLVYEKGSLKTMRQLDSVGLDSLSALSAMGGGKEYIIAENVQVLLRDGTGGYYLTDLSQVNGEEYTLTGWYDSLGFSAGGRIRIIVAVPG